MSGYMYVSSAVGLVQPGTALLSVRAKCEFGVGVSIFGRRFAGISHPPATANWQTYAH